MLLLENAFGAAVAACMSLQHYACRPAHNRCVPDRAAAMPSDRTPRCLHNEPGATPGVVGIADARVVCVRVLIPQVLAMLGLRTIGEAQLLRQHNECCFCVAPDSPVVALPTLDTGLIIEGTVLCDHLQAGLQMLPLCSSALCKTCCKSLQNLRASKNLLENGRRYMVWLVVMRQNPELFCNTDDAHFNRSAVSNMSLLPESAVAFSSSQTGSTSSVVISIPGITSQVALQCSFGATFGSVM